MKKLILICLTACLLLTGCSEGKTESGSEKFTVSISNDWTYLESMSVTGETESSYVWGDNGCMFLVAESYVEGLSGYIGDKLNFFYAMLYRKFAESCGTDDVQRTEAVIGAGSYHAERYEAVASRENVNIKIVNYVVIFGERVFQFSYSTPSEGSNSEFAIRAEAAIASISLRI